MLKAGITSKEGIVGAAMPHFWRRGYEAMSMDALVRATKSNRHAIYTRFGGKKNLFLACLDAYRDHVVTPAFAAVEAEGAGLEAIEAYFQRFMAEAEAAGLSAAGCLMANTMTEVAPHDEEVMVCIRTHYQRLKRGFYKVLLRLNHQGGQRNDHEINELAEFLVIATQGLWASARVTAQREGMQHFVRNLIYQIEGELYR